MATTEISWTEVVWNPTTGCDKVSPGCDHCYAMAMAKRLKGMGQAKYQNDGDPRTSGPGFGVTMHPDALGLPLKWRKPKRIFVNSMSDLFHEKVSDEFIAKVWQVMGAAPQHTFQILTKRHARMRSWVNRWYAGEIAEPFDAREVLGYPGYRVTTTGLVIGRRSDTADGLTPDIGEQGHRRVTMHRGGSPNSGERELVHRLVLTTFVRPPVPGEQACHRNGDPSDNRLSNLYWGTQQDNWRDRSAHGNRRSNGESAYRVAKDYPVSDTQIRNIIGGDQWKPELGPIVVRQPERVVLPQVWLGVSAEDQRWADIRIPALLDTLAAVHWISAEPLLGRIDLGAAALVPYEREQGGFWRYDARTGPLERPQGKTWVPAPPAQLGWVVCGGESGPGARPMDLAWATSLRDQCVRAGIPFHFKQGGSVLGREWGGHSKGGDPARWPEPFPREYPAAVS